MKLLVSVVDADEARAAAAAGADIVDVKNPAEGSLGAPSPAVIAGVRAAVSPELPVSAAIGDMPNLPGTAALAALGAARSGATFVKLGLWGVSTEAEAVALLRAVRAGVADVPGTVVVAAAYADARRVAHAPLAPELLPRVARAAGIRVCLLDTAVKDGRGLLEWLSPDALTALVAEAHAAGLEVALAGALRAEDLPVVRATGADIAGVRSAACGGGRRSGPLDPERVRALRSACAAAAGASMSPATCSRWAHLRALSSRVAAGTASPQASAASVGTLQQVVEDLRRGLGLDQAAQAEADVPAFVALDPLDALAHSGQGAVGQVVEQRVLPGVEDDPLEQHVVEADALAEPGAAGGELGGHRRQPLLEELEQRGRGVVPGRRAPLGRRRLRAARAPRRRSGRRAARGAARRGAGGRRPRPSGSPGRSASTPGRRRRTASRCSATASSATQKPASSVVRRARRSSGSSGHARASGARSMAAGFHCRRATIREKKLGQKLRLREHEVPGQPRSFPELLVSHRVHGSKRAAAIRVPTVVPRSSSSASRCGSRPLMTQVSNARVLRAPSAGSRRRLRAAAPRVRRRSGGRAARLARPVRDRPSPLTSTRRPAPTWPATHAAIESEVTSHDAGSSSSGRPAGRSTRSARRARVESAQRSAPGIRSLSSQPNCSMPRIAMRCAVSSRSPKRRSASRTASAKPAPPGTTSSGWRSPSSPSVVHNARSASRRRPRRRP